MTENKGLLRLTLTLVACSFFLTTQAHAWYATGHALVGQIAYDNMSEEKRHAFIKLLQNHPRFEKDFIDRMPAAMASSSTVNKEQWLFRQSGSWPDKARAFRGNLRRRFHEPRWHYIYYPLRIRRDGKQLGAIPETDRRSAPSSDMNAVQAVAAHSVVAADSMQSAADRAVSLTWIFHLVGDLHQPLHTTALFTKHSFPNGDRGGNAIPIKGQGSVRNLHSFWDTVIGRSVSDRIQVRQATLITERFPAAALSSPRSIDVSLWVRESVLISDNIAYGATIRNHVSSHEETPGKLPPVLISEQYRARARTIAEERIALAGYRLAEVLANTLAADVEK